MHWYLHMNGGKLSFFHILELCKSINYSIWSIYFIKLQTFSGSYFKAINHEKNINHVRNLRRHFIVINFAVCNNPIDTITQDNTKCHFSLIRTIHLDVVSDFALNFFTKFTLLVWNFNVYRHVICPSETKKYNCLWYGGYLCLDSRALHDL